MFQLRRGDVSSIPSGFIKYSQRKFSGIPGPSFLRLFDDIAALTGGAIQQTAALRALFG
jgi:hypothetical protein